MVALRVGIAGCGIGGLAAGALLARDGHEVLILDRFAAPAPVGSGLVVQPVGQAVLAACGALDAALAKGQPIRRMVGRDVTHGRRVLDVHYDRNGRRFGLAIHRASLFEALLEAAQEAGVTVRSNSTVAGSEGGQIRLETGETCGPFDLIIDACGAGSPLSPLKGRELPYGAIWGTVPWPEGTRLPRDQLVQRYRRANRMVGVLPIGTLPGEDIPKAAIFWSLRRESIADWKAAPLADWKSEAKDLWPAFGEFLATIESHDDMTPAIYSHGSLSSPIAPGLARIGDAAHRASPQLGQGANMALLDAYALLAALRDAPVDAALTRYAHSRRWHTGLYQAMSWAFTPQYQSDSRILPYIRDLILMPVSLIPPAPSILSRLVCGDVIPPVRGHRLDAAPRSEIAPGRGRPEGAHEAP